jgi:hypothetical protein
MIDLGPHRILQGERNDLIPAHWRTTGALRGAAVLIAFEKAVF